MQGCRNFPSTNCISEQSHQYQLKMPRQQRQIGCTELQSTYIETVNRNGGIQLRKKLHQSRSQNFSLKQQLSKQRKYTLQLEESIAALRNQIQQNLRELSISDAQIQNLTNQLNQSVEYIAFLQQKIRTIQTRLSQKESVVQSQNRHITNLNQQNLFLLQIKQLLSNQNSALRTSYSQIDRKYRIKQKQIYKLNIEINYLIKDISNLEDLLQNKNEQILTYETFLANKDRESKQSMECQVQKMLMDEKFGRKLQKYKKKAFRYKQERDELLKQIQQAKQEIGSITLRKYFQSDDTRDNNYSFQKIPSTSIYT